MYTVIDDDKKKNPFYPVVMEPKKRKENQRKTRCKQQENASPPVGFRKPLGKIKLDSVSNPQYSSHILV